MKRSAAITRGLGALGAALLLAAPPSLAQTSTNLAGKTVQLVIGFGVGGGYDAWGRLLSRHIGDHLPGHPTVVPQNMPGAGSFVAASWIYNAAPKDGTALGLIARDAPLGPLTGVSGANFDPTKLSWIGTPTTETNICIANTKAPVKTAQDLFTKQLIVGDEGVGDSTYTYPKALNALLGMKFKLIGGFQASANVMMAMERGEVDGICESLDTLKTQRPNWISTHAVNILFQGGAEPNPEIKDVPYVLSLARNDVERQEIAFLYSGQGIGRPFIAPPGLSPANLKMLRDAFDATMKDPAFLADAKKQRLDVEPKSGAYLENLIEKTYATPKPIVTKVGAFIKP